MLMILLPRHLWVVYLKRCRAWGQGMDSKRGRRLGCKKLKLCTMEFNCFYIKHPCFLLNHVFLLQIKFISDRQVSYYLRTGNFVVFSNAKFVALSTFEGLPFVNLVYNHCKAPRVKQPNVFP